MNLGGDGYSSKALGIPTLYRLRSQGYIYRRLRIPLAMSLYHFYRNVSSLHDNSEKTIFENGIRLNQPVCHSTWTTSLPEVSQWIQRLEERTGNKAIRCILFISLHTSHHYLILIYPNIYLNSSSPITIPEIQSTCPTPTRLNPTTTSFKLNVITKPSLVTSSPIFNPCPPPINPNPSHYPYPLTVTTCPPTIRLQPLTGTRSPSPP